jgi:tRNA (mo5U34)-methyltransferase
LTVEISKQQLQAMVQAVPVWFHSMDLGQGVVTPGVGSVADLEMRLDSLQLPDLRGKSVLDINTMDGFFAFEAERRGARRVTALDHYMWAMDMAEHSKYWLGCKEKGLTPRAYHEMPYYRPDEMPGKIGFETACRALQSNVGAIVAEFMEMDLTSLGSFEVVLYLGSLYHMENPLQALRRVAKVTKDVAIIETEATVFPGYEDHAVCEFFESNELNGDVSNWWAPNEKALIGMCRAAGFSRVSTIVGRPTRSVGERQLSALGSLRERFGPRDRPRVKELEVLRYRAIVHAWK